MGKNGTMPRDLETVIKPLIMVKVDANETDYCAKGNLLKSFGFLIKRTKDTFLDFSEDLNHSFFE